MKFQDDISNLHTYIHTYIHTDKPKPICPHLYNRTIARGTTLGHFFVFLKLNVIGLSLLYFT